MYPELAYEFVVQHWHQLAVLAGDMFAAQDELLPTAARGLNERSKAQVLLVDQARLSGGGAAVAAEAAARISLMAGLRERERSLAWVPSHQ